MLAKGPRATLNSQGALEKDDLPSRGSPRQGTEQSTPECETAPRKCKVGFWTCADAISPNFIDYLHDVGVTNPPDLLLLTCSEWQPAFLIGEGDFVDSSKKCRL